MALDLLIERPVAGGRMLARHGGKVVLVSGAIPGERVRARIERATRQMIWAEAIDILDSSRDRRPTSADPACGGALYSHIHYERQLQLKGEVVADAFRRIAKMPLAEAPRVAGSPEHGYRLRARLHVSNARVGFFRDGTHTLCDPGPTTQLHAGALSALEFLKTALGRRLEDCDSLIVSENVDATGRVIHLAPREEARLDDVHVPLAGCSFLSGVTTSHSRRLVVIEGDPTVSDSAAQLFGADPPVKGPVVWARHATSFFQANRFLVGSLVRCVLAAAAGETCVDLYSGVGLFAVALAARGTRVIAVEGDPQSEADLRANAASWRDRLRVSMTAVEDFVSQPINPTPDLVVLDPPRAGVAAGTLEALLRWDTPRLVYVSCDPPTLARDVRRLSAGGYRLSSIEAFDLFPNTPHVETVVTLDRA